MFEDEGSLRRRPRGFRRKQQLKSYSAGTIYYTTANGYESGPITSEMPNCYSTQPYSTYDYGPVGPATTFSDSWPYPTDGLTSYQKLTHSSIADVGSVSPPPPPPLSSTPTTATTQTSSNILDYGYQYNTSPYGIDNGKFYEI